MYFLVAVGCWENGEIGVDRIAIEMQRRNAAENAGAQGLRTLGAFHEPIGRGGVLSGKFEDRPGIAVRVEVAENERVSGRPGQRDHTGTLALAHATHTAKRHAEPRGGAAGKS